MAIDEAEKHKRETYPELVQSSTCQLVVLACEVGGRWSETCTWLVRTLAEEGRRTERSDVGGARADHPEI